MPKYKINDLVATREAYGDALVELGKKNPEVVVLDGETSNSTYSEKFRKVFPRRYLEMFIAEQNMVSVALGLSKTGFVPFVSTFAAFLTRAFDQIRMAQYSQPDLKIVGSHAGVSIGQDGPSQMGLEDLAMFCSVLESIVFYPSDAVSTLRLTHLMAKNKGLFYLRTTRGKTPVIYKNEEEFKIGGSKTFKFKVQMPKFKVLIISAGITLFEALKAQKELAKEKIEAIVMDCYCVKPLDVVSINQLIKTIPNVIVVEDHYPSGGLGEAVLTALHNNTAIQQLNNFIHLCVRKLPRSGTPEELLHYEEIDAAAIVTAVKKLLLL